MRPIKRLIVDTVDSAVDALKQDALDYLMNPYELDELVGRIKSAARRKQQPEARIRELRARPYISERRREQALKKNLNPAGPGKI